MTTILDDACRNSGFSLFSLLNKAFKMQLSDRVLYFDIIVIFIDILFLKLSAELDKFGIAGFGARFGYIFFSKYSFALSSTVCTVQ